MSDLLRIVVVLLLVLGNAIFVAAEYALVTARRGRSMKDERLLDTLPDNFIATHTLRLPLIADCGDKVNRPWRTCFFVKTGRNRWRDGVKCSGSSVGA